jgi:hypothetical protein
MSRRSLFSLAIVALFAFGLVGTVQAAKKPKEDPNGTHTVTGKSSCATEDGVTKGGNGILLTDSKGIRWVLLGGTDEYRAAQKVRKEGKMMTVTYTGKPEVKKDSKGKEYAEISVDSIKVDN